MFLKDIIARIKFPFRKDKELYSSFYKMLGFYPSDISYYKQALLHKSSSIKSDKGKWVNNERLEFLGDAILDAIVGDIVYRHFEGKREGFLTNTRSKIVQRETLNKIAVEIGLDKLIKYSSHSSAHNSYMHGNAFEALIGAIYLDRGYDYCMKFVAQRIMHRLINIDKVAYKEVNFKSKLIEWGQKNRVNISFKLLKQTIEGSSTPVFNSQAIVEGIECGKGQGYSKKESQQIAAKETLEILKKCPSVMNNIFKNRDKRAIEEKETLLKNLSAQQEKEDSSTRIENKKSAATLVLIDEQIEPTKLNPQEPELENTSFDFSDIAVEYKEPSKEEIIAAAEAVAFDKKNS